jgi:hypothetical protein
VSALFSLLKQRCIKSDFSEMHCFIADTFQECILILRIFYLNYLVVEEIIPFDIWKEDLRTLLTLSVDQNYWSVKWNFTSMKGIVQSLFDIMPVHKIFIESVTNQIMYVFQAI